MERVNGCTFIPRPPAGMERICFRESVLRHVRNQTFLEHTGVCALESRRGVISLLAPDDTGRADRSADDRQDGVINVCEMKFSTNEFTIDKKYARELRERLATFGRGGDEKANLPWSRRKASRRRVQRWNWCRNSVRVDALFAA